MSLYSKTARIDGIPFGLVMRGVSNGQYVIVFERECATLEQIEAIHWERPAIEGETILPRDYGYEVENIAYESCTRSYKVTVRVGRQYLGDVTAYQDTIAALREEREADAAKREAQQDRIAALESELAEADEALIALYEQQAAQGSEKPEGPETQAPAAPEGPAETEGEEVQA